MKETTAPFVEPIQNAVLDMYESNTVMTKGILLFVHLHIVYSLLHCLTLKRCLLGYKTKSCILKG